MTYVYAALVLLTVLCLINVLLVFGVIRRLREQTAMLRPSVMTLPVGASVASFTATTTTGNVVTVDMLADGIGLVGGALSVSAFLGALLTMNSFMAVLVLGTSLVTG